MNEYIVGIRDYAKTLKQAYDESAQDAVRVCI